MNRCRSLMVSVMMASVISTAWGISDTPIEDRLRMVSNYNYEFGILQFGNTIYLGGNFSEIGGKARNDIAAFDSTTGNVLDWYPNPSYYNWDPTSFALSEDEKRLFVGQNGSVLSCDPVIGDVQWATLINYTANPRVYAIAVNGHSVYFGGVFNSVQNRSRNNLVRVNATTGLLDETWAPNPNGRISSIQIYNGKVYVCGSFSQIAGESRNYLVRFDAQTGDLDGWNPNVNGVVVSMVISNGKLYVGGSFTRVGNDTRNNLASFDLTSGALISWAPSASGIQSGFLGARIYALADGKDGKLYVGGSFGYINNTSRINLAAVDAISGELDPWNPKPNNTVYSLYKGLSHLMVGGSFTSMGTSTGPAYFAEFYDPREQEQQVVEFDVLPYPNPFRPNQGHTDMTFDQIPSGSTVKIYSVNGQLVKSMTAGDAGEVVWAGVRNDDGEPVSSGVYYGVAEGNGESKMFKVIVQR
jgi:hypothetical protein